MSAAYDERLAAAAPAATPAEKQEGYDIDLLNEQHSGRGVSVTPPPLPVLSANHAKAEEGEFTTDYTQPRAVVPWYKTRKWLLIFLLGAVVIVAAVIGGAVGGTVGHNHKATKVDTSDSGGGGAEGSTASNGDGAGQAASRDTSQVAASSTTQGTIASSIAISGLIPTVTSSSDEHDHGHGSS
ncbi:hypothetical protein FKP32DRAFT_1677768 [Trametes sanguinea]|nr:hypothetical protein FKP32DRAFT_1677768 [Trametes sanguinea]